MWFAADTAAMAGDPAEDREQALEAVAERCARRGFSIAYRLLRDRADAEDAVQLFACGGARPAATRTSRWSLCR